LAARSKIAELCSGQDFAAGDTILNHLDTARDVFFVLSGDVEVSLFSVNGKRITFHDKGAGQMVGELAALDGEPRCATVIAKTDCRMISISPDNFLHVVSVYPSAALRVLKRLTGQVRELSARVFEFNALCVNNRIHVELLRYASTATADGQRRIISPTPTHADLAARVSTHREAVTRELGKLIKLGLLEKAKDSLIVVDIEQLEELVEQSLGEIPVVC
jgi:CRP/FNR family cyclic AMP-dependent transcriptional regulator